MKHIAPVIALLHNALIVGGDFDQLWQKIPKTPEAVEFANRLQDVLVQAHDALAERQT